MKSSIPTGKSTEIFRELSENVGGEVRFDNYSRQMYSTDGSIYKIDPLGVVIPRNSDDVISVHEISSKNKTIITPRGGGTSLSGQTVNSGIVVDFSKYMNKIIEVCPEEKWVRAQPGITIDNLNRHLSSYGLFFTPDPSTSSRANIGGAMGNNSCGAHSILYGKTVDQVLEMEIILSNGSKILCSENSLNELKTKLSLQSFEGMIYKSVVDISTRAAPEVKSRYPKILRRIGGYNLDLIHQSEPVNLSKIIVGSEGTLASVSEAKLNLETIPKFKAVSIFHFDNIYKSMEASVEILRENPAAVEHIGHMIIQQARQSLGFSKNLTFLQGNPTDILVVETNAETKTEILSKLNTLENRIKKLNLSYAVTRLLKTSDQQKVWNMRQAGLGLIMNIPGDAKPLPFVEDTAVSPEKLPEYVKRFDEIVKSNGTEAGYYGHASVGCLHIRPVVNVKTKEGIDRMYQIANEVSDLVLEFGGAYSGEHGDGIVRGAWAKKLFGEKLIGHFREIKDTFDPLGIMNPGKIFDTPPMTENLRYGQKYKTTTFEETFDWTQENGFAGALEKCNGVGACRKVKAGAMCPSYQATLEEEHSTRGRANALRAAISGSLPFNEFSSERMYKVLDLCLECKSCKSECPSNVDMAKIKYEFLHNYYLSHKVPLRSKMIANIHKINSLSAGIFSVVFNIIIRSQPVRLLLDYLVGLDKRRKTPRVVSQTFESWFKSRTPNTTGSRGDIILFHDTFMNFNHPESGIGATKLLESLGFRVKILNRKCCGRPMISKGLLGDAKTNALTNVELLYKYVEKGVKIVGCESSCIMAIQDEYPDLLKGNQMAKEVSQNTFLIQQIISSTADDGLQQIKWTKRKLDIMLHVHCHERALLGTEAAINTLNYPTGYEAKLIDAGCCGMAGSFGFEKEHYDMSMTIGEDRLFPAIRSAGQDVVVAVTGVSCKQQVEDGTNRKAKYFSEVLSEALED
ncbi:MAG: FAD-linked oxidase C-terminal domain-containing protein [Dehalococcoidia bacterium]|jgi:FAD/FMN-containing dehydrogenase/Fe-S oxidoreductase|nr:FAD-linked oxidase C-terminal domain-containing protein [Dehalococcoidia bacterium]